MSKIQVGPDADTVFLNASNANWYQVQRLDNLILHGDVGNKTLRIPEDVTAYESAKLAEFLELMRTRSHQVDLETEIAARELDRLFI